MNAIKCANALLAIAIGVVGAAAAIAEPITFSRVTGNVSVDANGQRVAVRDGSIVNTPLRIVTGADGSLHIEQASSALDIGPDSIIVVPGTNEQSGVVEKILQQVGRVLYSVKPRKQSTFVVETPYLVSVVKGTTFSVAVDQTSSAVTLLEGVVEVTGPGSDDRALLQPNQRAQRAAGERTISVSTIDTSAYVSPPRAFESAPAPPQFNAQPDELALTLQASRVVQDLAELSALHNEPAPPEPDSPATPDGGSAPTPDTQPTTPNDDAPDSPPAPPPPLAIPVDSTDDDDGNSGHGDDDDRDDDDNPGSADAN